MMTEILEGRGAGPDGDHVFLKLDHLGKELLDERLPGISELSKTFAHVDPAVAPIPVVPTCHYMMGGVPTNIHGQAIAQDANGNESIVDGLFACGEVACVSVHGANRLGGNSLLDLVVFGRAAGLYIEDRLGQGMEDIPVSDDDIQRAMERLNKVNGSESGDDASVLRKELQTIMQNYFGVFRDGEYMKKGRAELEALRPRVENVYLSDK